MFSCSRFQAGWTLIELLVVLVILSGLMTLAIPQVLQVTSRTDQIAAQQLLLEALASVQLQGEQSVEMSCTEFYEQELQRFRALELSLQCSILSKNEILLVGAYSANGQYSLSSIHGFTSTASLSSL